MEIGEIEPVIVTNAAGSSPFVLVCDHASNRIPTRYGTLGLSETERLSHIAWDPGALAVSLKLVDLLDAPLVRSTVSRLIIDCNRGLDAPDLIWTLSERTRITANERVDAAERQFRIDNYHRPYHAAIDALLTARQQAGRETILVCVHSFNPVYHDEQRPWPIGLLHGVDTRFTQALFDALKADDSDLNVGWNQPYAALLGVTLTIELHGDGRGLGSTMIELRNDEILAPPGVTKWAAQLAKSLTVARQRSLKKILPARSEPGGS